MKDRQRRFTVSAEGRSKSFKGEQNILSFARGGDGENLVEKPKALDRARHFPHRTGRRKNDTFITDFDCESKFFF